jgi:hypothetical protein
VAGAAGTGVSVGGSGGVKVGVGGIERTVSIKTVAVKVGKGVRVGGRLASAGADRKGKPEQARDIKVKKIA